MKQNQRDYVTKLQDAYTPKAHTKLDDLKRLDKKARTPALVIAYVFGTIGSLVLGFGMAIALKALSLPLVLGIVLGCVGLVLCGSNYFLYKAILKSGKKKYADKIVSISHELLNETH